MCGSWTVRARARHRGSRKMSELNGRVIIRNVPPQPMKVLGAAGISRFVTIENTGKVV